MFTIAPLPRSIIDGRVCFAHRKAAFRSTSKTWSHSASVIATGSA